MSAFNDISNRLYIRSRQRLLKEEALAATWA
jgi:hypothetical protein